MSKIVCDCVLCRCEKVFSLIYWDSVIKSLEHPTDITRIGTVSTRLQQFLLAKLSLEFKEVECKKNPKPEEKK